MTWRLIPDDRPLRTVLVGAGPMGRHWARTLQEHPGAELVGWADLDSDRAVEAARSLALPALPVSANLGHVLDAERPDMLVNCTYPAAHLATTLSAFERGIHVLTEKPMAPSLAEARSMAHAAEAAGLLLVVSQNRRFLPGMLALRRAVARLGTLSVITSEFFIAHRASDYVLRLPDPMLTEMAVHLFDAARVIAGTDAESVFCDAYRSPWSWFAGNDTVCALFRMAGGIRYSFNAGWSARGHATSWTGSWRVVGELGTVTWDGVHAPVLESGVVPVDADIECAAPSRPFHELTDVLTEFIRALRIGAMPQGESHDNLRSLAMVQAAVESAATGIPAAVNGY